MVRWPPPLVEALRSLGVDARTATRGDGRISLRVEGGRLDLSSASGGTVVMSAALGTLPRLRAERDRLILASLRTAAPAFGPFRPSVCILAERLVVQCRVPANSAASVALFLSQFAQEMRRLRFATPGQTQSKASDDAPLGGAAFLGGMRHVYL